MDSDRWVGDPVDVVTGAQTDRALDFTLHGDFDVLFYRHYDSRRLEEAGLGPGFRHGFDHRLRFDVDGIRYEAPDGSVARFPFLMDDGARASAPGWHLTRVSLQDYTLTASDRSQVLSFRIDRDARGVLHTLQQGRHGIRLHHRGDRCLVGTEASTGYRVRFDWDGQRLVRAVWTNPADGRPRTLISYQYDAQGRLAAGTDAYGHSFGLTYDEHHRVVRRTDRNGYSFEFRYDDQGRCVRARGQDGVLEVQLSFEPQARMTKVTRGDDGEWLYFYDDEQTLLQVIDPYGGTTVYGRDAETGRIDQKIDPAGNVTKYVYDHTGKLTGLVAPTGEPYAPGEDPPQLHHRVGAREIEWELGLNTQWEFTLPTRADALRLVSPDVRGALAIAPARDVGPFLPIRDAYGLLIREQRADGAQRRYAYDANGNLRTYVDADGRIYRQEFGSFNLLAAEQDPLGHTVRHSYNRSEKRTLLLDAGGTRSEYVYDKKDRLIEVQRHGKLRERYLYDLADRLIEKQGSDGQPLVKWTYGAGPRKATRELASGEKQSFAHDAKGRLTQAKGDAGELRFAYDLRGRRVQDLRDGRGVVHGDGWLDTRVLGRFVTRLRLVDERRSVLVDPTGGIHRLTRDAHGVLIRELAQGMRETVQFHPDGMPLTKALEAPGSALPLWIRRYHYDREGNLLRSTDTERGAHSYAYDGAGRLTSQQTPDGQVEPYEYDEANNLLRMPGLSEGEVVAQGVHTPGAPRIAGGQGNRIYRANGELFHYNARDHVAQRATASGKVTRYHYDSLDQLSAIDAPGLRWTAKYDVLGRRTEKTVNGERWQYYWDTDRLAAEVFPDGRLRVYVYAGEQALVPLLFVDYAAEDAAPESGKVSYVFTNHLGAPERVTDVRGNTVWLATIAPYGSATVHEGSDFHQSLRWPGHFFDDETGLHYNRFRYYDPSLGRYLQSDPDGIRGGYNLYAYTDNPLRQVDVRGLGCPGDAKTQEESEDAPEQERTEQQLLPAPRPAMRGTPEELARAPGNSPEQRAVREAVARDFYQRNCPGLSPAKLDSHIRGIDYNYPVHVVRIPPGGAGPQGNQIRQFSFPGGGPGEYFTHEPGTTANQLGINDRVLLSGSGNAPPRIVPREQRVYQVEPGTAVEGLRSTAAPIEDDWSISGQPKMTEGGGSQTMIPRSTHGAIQQT